MDVFVLLIIILQQTLFLRSPLVGAFVPAQQFQMWHEISDEHVCVGLGPARRHAAPLRTRPRSSACVKEPLRPLARRLQAFHKPHSCLSHNQTGTLRTSRQRNKKKKVLERDVLPLAFLLQFLSFAIHSTFIYESKIVAYFFSKSELKP